MIGNTYFNFIGALLLLNLFFYGDGVLHVNPEQQPVEQEQPVHTPAEHMPDPHDAQAAPPDPHALLALPG